MPMYRKRAARRCPSQRPRRSGRVRNVASLVAIVLLFTACGGGDSAAPTTPTPPGSPPGSPPGEPVVASIDLSRTSADLVPGERLALSATTRATGGTVLTGRPVTWRSTAPQVATVGADGDVTAVATGTAEVIASSGSASATARITVRDGGLVGPAGGTVTADSGAVQLVIPPGAVAAPLAVTVRRLAAPPGVDTSVRVAYEFGPSGTQFAVPVQVRLRFAEGLSADSVVQFLRVRRFTDGRWHDLDSVFVLPRSRYVEGRTSSFSTYGLGWGFSIVHIRAQPATTTMYAGESRSIVFVLTDKDGRSLSAADFDTPSNGRLRWSTDGELQASISGLSAIVRPTSAVPNLRVTLTWEHNGLWQCQETERFVRGRCAIGWEQGQNGIDTLWANTPDAATILMAGPVRAMASAVVTVVNVPVASVLVTPDSSTVAVGATRQLTATVRDSAGGTLTGRVVSWSTSNSAIASVSSTGLVTGHAPGTVTITATSEGRSGTARVTAMGSASPVALLVIDPVNTPIEVGLEYPLAAVAYDSGGAVIANAPVVWTALDPAIATVSPDGVVTGVATGTGARIRAASGGRTSLQRVDVVPASPIVRGIPAAGNGHVCLLRDDGSVWCWGKGDHGALGNGSTVPAQSTPVQVAGGPYVALSAGGGGELLQGNYGSTCALRQGGQAECWGSNFTGQLGDGTTTMRTTPVSVSGGGFSRIWVGAGRTCAVGAGGGGWCWGSNVGATGTTDSPLLTPRMLVGLPNVSVIAPGGSAACALSGAGARCWGSGTVGMLGNGSFLSSSVPVAVAGGGFDDLVGSATHMCGLAGVATWCWGANDGGRLGIGGTTGNSNVPVLVAGAPAFTKLAAGGSGTCGLDATGAAWCWGGIVGSSTPVRVPGGHQFTEITVGGFVACGAATTGIWCWGNNEFGQLGNGRVVSWPQKIPVKVRFPQ